MANNSDLYGLQVKVKADIQQMITDGYLTGLATTSVKVRKVPSGRDFSTKSPLPSGMTAYPAVFISPGPRETIDEATNLSDDYGYPVLVVISDVDNQDLDSNHDTYLMWRQRIISKFVAKQTVCTDPSVTYFDCFCEPGPIVDWNRFMGDGVFVGSFVLRFKTRKRHGYPAIA